MGSRNSTLIKPKKSRLPAGNKFGEILKEGDQDGIRTHVRGFADHSIATLAPGRKGIVLDVIEFLQSE